MSSLFHRNHDGVTGNFCCRLMCVELTSASRVGCYIRGWSPKGQVCRWHGTQNIAILYAIPASVPCRLCSAGFQQAFSSMTPTPRIDHLAAGTNLPSVGQVHELPQRQHDLSGHVQLVVRIEMNGPDILAE